LFIEIEFCFVWKIVLLFRHIANSYTGMCFRGCP